MLHLVRARLLTPLFNQSVKHEHLYVGVWVVPLSVRLTTSTFFCPGTIVRRHTSEHLIDDSHDADACFIRALARQLGSKTGSGFIQQTAYITESA